MKVSKNMRVSMAYKLYVDGNLVDESGTEPFSFIYGYSQVIPGVEKNLEGLTINDEKTFVVEPVEGYGEKRDDLVQRIPVNQFPPNAKLEIGQVFEVKDANGRPLQFAISSIEDEEIVADFNHPLAGKTLKFEVIVKNVEAADEKEIANLMGFATSCDGSSCSSCSEC